MAQSGKIQAITGNVTAQNAEGQVRELQVGDLVYDNEIIVTADGATVSIIQEDGNLIELAANEQLLLDESVVGNIDPTDSAIEELTDLQQAIVQAIENDTDIEALLEETAAGAGADGAYDFRAGYHAGDTSKGDVGSYLLGTENEFAVSEYEQFVGDEDQVGDVNDAPVVTDDTLSATEDTPITYTAAELLGNDYDPEGSTISIASVTSGTGGSVVLNNDGTVTFTPNENFNGDADFTYTITDGDLTSNTATVTIGVVAENDAPVVNDGTATVSEEGLADGIPEATGSSHVTTGTMNFSDVDDTLVVGLTPPSDITSGGADLSWSGTGGSLTGSVGANDIITIQVDPDGAYTVTLLGPIDHPNTTLEDTLDLEFGVTVTEADNEASIETTLTVTVEDDSPVAHSSLQQVEVATHSIGVGSLSAGFEDYTFSPNWYYVSQVETNDGDTIIDEIWWGYPVTTGQQSGYSLIDNTQLTGANTIDVTAGNLFTLGTFTHSNYPIYSGYSTLGSTQMAITIDVFIDGVGHQVDFQIQMAHQETTNTSTPGDDASRDIITLPSQQQTFTIDGESYTVYIDGFVPVGNPGGNPEQTIYTYENMANTYDIMAHIESIDILPVLSGKVLAETGADGSSDTLVVWDTVTTTYGTFDGNPDGSYSFTVNRATKDGLDPDEVLALDIGYSITDKDGDSSSSTLTLAIYGSEAELMEGDAGNNTLVGTTGDDTLSGENGNDTIYGGDGVDTISGGRGRDTISGGDGADIINAGSGNDQIIFDSNDTTVDGGGGSDTLLISDSVLDFSNVQNIEKVELNAPDAQTINLSLNDVLSMTDRDNVLELEGGDKDIVNIDSTGWTQDATNRGLFTNDMSDDRVEITSSTNSSNDFTIDFTDPNHIDI